MDERSEITNRWRWRRPLGAVAATAAAAVVVSTATAGGIALLRRRGGGGNSNGRNSNSNNGFDRGHLRRRVLHGHPADGPAFVPEPFIVTLPTTGMGFSDPSPRTHNDPPPHGDPMDEFFPSPHTDPVPPHTDPTDEFYDPPPPHTDPADDFESLFCADDPEFRYDFKGAEVSCGSLRADRRSMALCRKELDGGEILGIRSCPETCGMVDECLAAASGMGEGRGGKGPTAVLRTKYWWPSSHCVYSSAYPDEYLQPSIQEFVLFDTEEECCSTYHTCQAEATTVPTPPSNGAGGAGGGSRERWYPKLVDAVPSCVRDTDYPEEVVANPDVAATFLHETREECCWAFPNACLRFFWHPASPGDATSGCLYGEDYPQSTVDAGHLYLTEGDCEVAMEAAAETADPNAAPKSDPSPPAASSTSSTAATSTSASSSATSAATETTAGTTTFPRAEHWWPVEPVSGARPSHCVFSDTYPGDYLHPAVRDFVLFDTKEACCEAYQNCETQVTTAPTPPNGAGGGAGAGGVREERWYPQMVDSVPSCVRGADYPAEYADPEFSAAFLFDTQLGCCGAFPSACLHFFWHPASPGDASSGCLYGEDYPQSTVDEGHLYVTEEDCEVALEAAAETANPNPGPESDPSPSAASSTSTAATSTSTSSPLSSATSVATEATAGTTTTTSSAATSTSTSTSSSSATSVATEATAGTTTTTSTAATSTSTSSSSSSSATSAATETTAVTTTVPRAEHWWPVEPVSGNGPSHCVFSDAYPGDYLHPSVRDFVLFDTKEACCEAYHNCDAQVTTVPTPPNGAGGGGGAGGVREERWYPRMVDSVPSCVRGADYPAEYGDPEFSAAFLFDSQLGCCGAFPSACHHFFWYPSAPGNAGGGCVYGEGYSQAVVDEGHLYVTEGECCDVWCGETETTTATTVASSETTVASAETTAGTVVASSTTTSIATLATTADVAEPCTDCVWHESITAFKTCTNSPSYPPSWDNPMAHQYFFFRTAEDCCATRFPDDCTTEDVHAVGGPGEAGGGDVVGEFVPLGPRTIDNFDGDAQGLPFDFGAPDPQWILDAAVSHSGAQSVTNIPRDGLGATADLTLKISVAHPSSIQCMAIVDTSMPYEMFYLEVNGNRRNSYHQPDQGGWFMVMTGLGPGENEIVFRVENADFEYGLPGERHERFGTGRVWLDDCEVSSM